MAKAALIASAALCAALLWDISWQTTFGSTTVWSPPHVTLLLLAGAVLALGFPQVAWPTARSGAPGPVASGCRLMTLGAVAIVVAGAVDAWWHMAQPPSLQVLTPPHVALAVGILFVWTGCLLITLAIQHSPPDAERRRSWGAVAHLPAAALILSWCALMATEYVGRPNLWHGSEFLWVSGGLFPVLLFAIGRSSLWNWAATTTALIFAVGTMIAIWVLQLVPVSTFSSNPEVVHLVPPPFPLLLVFPALAIDVLLYRARARRGPVMDHVVAGIGGVAFVGLLAVIHWYLGDLLLSPVGRGFVLGADHWPHHAILGDWRYQYWSQEVGRRAFAVGIGVAVAIAIVSARVGLWLGDRLGTLTAARSALDPKTTR